MDTFANILLTIFSLFLFLLYMKQLGRKMSEKVSQRAQNNSTIG